MVRLYFETNLILLLFWLLNVSCLLQSDIICKVLSWVRADICIVRLLENFAEVDSFKVVFRHFFIFYGQPRLLDRGAVEGEEFSLQSLADNFPLVRKRQVTFVTTFQLQVVQIFTMRTNLAEKVLKGVVWHEEDGELARNEGGLDQLVEEGVGGGEQDPVGAHHQPEHDHNQCYAVHHHQPGQTLMIIINTILPTINLIIIFLN